MTTEAENAANALKIKALELAHSTRPKVDKIGESDYTLPASDVVERAFIYHRFLSTAVAAAATAAPAAGKAAVAAGNAPAAAGNAPAAAGKAPAATPAAGTKPAAAAAGKAAPAATAAAAGAKSASPTTTAKTGVGGKPAAAPAGDTKDPKGNNTYDDVVAALQKVMRSVSDDNDRRDKGRKLAYDILAAKGGGVKGVRDLKPALYDAVVAGCEDALKPKTKAAVAAPPSDFEEDPLGDPPEETGGGVDAETGALVDSEDM